MPDPIMRITLIAIIFLALSGTAAVNASRPGNEPVITDVEQSKVSVRPEDLPEAVKSTIASSYSDWKITSAYLVTRDDNSQYYEVNIKRSEETSTLNLDKYGKKVD